MMKAIRWCETLDGSRFVPFDVERLGQPLARARAYLEYLSVVVTLDLCHRPAGPERRPLYFSRRHGNCGLYKCSDCSTL
jgi:hypothetical protein